MRTYTIKDGDTLGHIAMRELGDANRWPVLWKMNWWTIVAEQKRRRSDLDGAALQAIGTPHLIFAGTVIELPE